MDFEFDKEIDAILRKARPSRGVLVGDDPAGPKKHLDADTIVAFAENALPDKAKLLYVEHLADCDRCRKQLSFVMQMNKEPVEAVAAPAVVPALEASIPWYQKFFKAPNLALAIGALVLVFSGVLGYLVIQKKNASDSATVSQINEPEPSRGGPSFNNEAASNTATLEELIATANPTPPSANMSSNSASVAPGVSSDSFGRSDSDTSKSGAAPGKNSQVDGASGSENTFIIDGQEITNAKPPAKPAAAPQPPPVTTDTTSSGISMERDEKKTDAGKRKEESKDLELSKQRPADDRRLRDSSRAASKVGPSRGLGPVQNQSNHIYNKSYDMPVTRVVGGKTFNNRDGAWYDSAYHGQATANYRRGTADYKKLDAGLRNIADTVGGTVVVVWKSKAYRIQ
jgi:hypothetical protein